MVGTRRDDGFTLLEMIISVAIITIVTTALTVLFVNSISTTDHLRKTQVATRLATSSLDFARSIGAVGAKSNRSTTAVSAQFASFEGTDVEPWLEGMTPSVDPAPSGPADLPAAAVTQTVDGVTYEINYLVGTCYRTSSLSSAPQSCGDAPAASDGVPFVRVVVAVGWTDRTCASGRCYFATATLLNGEKDPQFNFRIDPPPPPELSDCQDQTVSVGQDVLIPVFVGADFGGTTMPPICTLTGGTPAFDWLASGLPDGLALDPLVGAISGTVTVSGPVDPDNPVMVVPTTLTVHDGQDRAATSQPFSWHILSTALELLDPTSIVAEADQAIGPLPLAIEGGSGDYTIDMASAPSWLTIKGDSGAGYTLEGLPESDDVGIGTVSLTVTDNQTGQVASFSISTLVTSTAGPTIAPVADQTWQAGEPVSFSVTASCVDASTCTWSEPLGLPPGLTWHADPVDEESGELTAEITGLPATPASGSAIFIVTDSAGYGGAAFHWQVTP